jgi:hypothetical protein
MNLARQAFREWTDCLLDPARAPIEHLGAARAWCTWVMGRLGMDEAQIDPRGDVRARPTTLPDGEAISPQRAVLCLREYRRTAVFLQATVAAVNAARARFPGEPIHVVEAGCGPAAPMALVAAARFGPGQVQVTLLDINPASLADVQRLAAELGVERAIRGTICGDAAAVRFAPGDRPHVVVAEVLRRALKKEPQVAVTRALAPQVRAGGFFLPERIALSPGFVLGSPDAAGGRRTVELGEIFALEAAGDSGMGAREVSVPGGVDDRLQLFTRLRVFGPHVLGDYECSLTMPEPLRVPAEFLRTGGKLRMAYEVSSDPGLRVVATEPAAPA